MFRSIHHLSALAALLALVQCAHEQKPSTPPAEAAQAEAAAKAKAEEDARAEAARAQELTQAAVDAYVYAYPLVTMEFTRRIMTNVPKREAMRGPMGQFIYARTYPDASFRDVTAPNADTLYTVVWLDVAKEPWVVHFPDMKGRYFLMPMLDGWTTVFADPGKRTTGTKAQTYAITGPGWSGTLPKGVTEIKSATSMVWVLGRIYSTGTPSDYAQVHKLQDGCTAVPLSSYGKKYTPPASVVDRMIDMKTPTREQVDHMDGASFFTLFASLLRTNPPLPDDAAMLAQLAKIGVVPGQDFDASKLDPAASNAVQQAPKLGQEKITAWARGSIEAGDAKLENGWLFTTHTGIYGTNYLQRALVTVIGLGANRPEDAVYPFSQGTTDGKPYAGANKYRLHFDKGGTPPVQGFWSLTMYDPEMFFVANKLNRYTVSSRSKFKKNKDGSVDVLIQKDPPAKAMMENWLPAPEGEFKLMLRLYWPSAKPPSLLNASWTIPAVTVGE
jgi:hypothetical protein